MTRYTCLTTAALRQLKNQVRARHQGLSLRAARYATTETTHVVATFEIITPENFAEGHIAQRLQLVEFVP
jgi:hypothetical protein